MSKIPVVRQISWVATIPQFIVLIALVVWIVKSCNSSNAAILVLGLYVAYSLLSRRLIASDQRRGIRLVKRKEFEKAISCFERSYDFFTRHPNLDRYRSIIMFSASLASYREMALVNIAFCYSQIGNGEKTKQYYRKALEIFPDSGIAQTGMNIVSAFEKKEDAGPPAEGERAGCE